MPEQTAADYLTTDQIAAIYPFWNRGFWAKLRVRGGGPRFYRVCGRVFYRQKDVADWIAGHAATSTAETKRQRRAA